MRPTKEALRQQLDRHRYGALASTLALIALVTYAAIQLTGSSGPSHSATGEVTKKPDTPSYEGLIIDNPRDKREVEDELTAALEHNLQAIGSYDPINCLAMYRYNDYEYQCYIHQIGSLYQKIATFWVDLQSGEVELVNWDVEELSSSYVP